MMAIPLCAVIVGGVAGLGLAAVVTPALNWLSAQIAYTIKISPLIGSALVSLSWSTLLMTPASSLLLRLHLNLIPYQAELHL